MQMSFRRVEWEYKSVFRIAYRTRTHSQGVLVDLKARSHVGRGEALGIFYHGDTIDTLLDHLANVANDVSNGISRTDLQNRMPPGGARNALDCALWDLEAKLAGRRVWELAALPTVHPLQTAYTLSLDTPEAMGLAAAAVPQYSILKLKLSGEGDVERVTRIRQARPDAAIIVDPNQAWNEARLHEFTPQLAKLGVTLIEQPMPVGKDDALAGFVSPIPICADESCQTTESLPLLVGKYQFVNIKLDKTGGLTEALRLARAALDMKFRLMVGCMGGSSLSMAPGFVVGQLCDVIDLDSPLLIKSDVPHAIRYEGSRMYAPETALWG